MSWWKSFTICYPRVHSTCNVRRKKKTQQDKAFGFTLRLVHLLWRKNRTDLQEGSVVWRVVARSGEKIWSYRHKNWECYDFIAIKKKNQGSLCRRVLCLKQHYVLLLMQNMGLSVSCVFVGKFVRFNLKVFLNHQEDTIGHNNCHSCS